MLSASLTVLFTHLQFTSTCEGNNLKEVGLMGTRRHSMIQKFQKNLRHKAQSIIIDGIVK